MVQQSRMKGKGVQGHVPRHPRKGANAKRIFVYTATMPEALLAMLRDPGAATYLGDARLCIKYQKVSVWSVPS